MQAGQIQLYMFDAGQVITRGVRFINPQGEIEERDMRDPNHCYLIRHPRGLLMWDTGLPDSIAARRGKVRRRGKFRFVLRRSLADQLAEAGILPAQVTYLALSHLQVDHAGNAGLFPAATVLVQAAEWEMAFSPEADDWGYIRPEFACLQNQPVMQLQGDHDVFSDGRVIILSAPGHTPGHQVLLVELDSGPVILSGDLYYAEKDPAEGWMPYWNVDREQTLRTMQRLGQIEKERGARWVLNHDPNPSRSLKLAPAINV